MSKDAVSEAELARIVDESEEQVWEPWKGCVVVAWKLPHGFVMSEMSAAVDKESADRNTGIANCRSTLRHRLRSYVAYERMMHRAAVSAPAAMGKAVLSTPMPMQGLDRIKSGIALAGYDFVDTVTGTHDSMEDAARSMKKMSGCDAVFFAYGWQDSDRCIAEHAFAKQFGLRVFEEKIGGRFAEEE